jgi:ABC-type phosphate transport system substrate-binding protein
MEKIKNIFVSIVALLVISSGVSASDSTQEVIYVSSARFSSPLVEKWIAEYSKQNPKVQIKLAEKDSKDVDLNFIAIDETEAKADHGIAYVGRYALLPVTTKANPLIEQITKKKFGKKDIKNLFFVEDFLGDEPQANKKDVTQNLTVYSGNNATSGSVVFALYFGYTPSNLKGKRISGDDVFLLTAIQKDKTGVTFNNLSYIYDLSDRRLKDEIALLPLDVKKEQLETLRSENLDETLSLLETQKVDFIPIQHIGFTYTDKGLAKDFLKWIITDGQQYNHEFGFLTLDEKTLAYQKSHIDANLLSATK